MIKIFESFDKKTLEDEVNKFTSDIEIEFLDIKYNVFLNQQLGLIQYSILLNYEVVPEEDQGSGAEIEKPIVEQSKTANTPQYPGIHYTKDGFN